MTSSFTYGCASWRRMPRGGPARPGEALNSRGCDRWGSWSQVPLVLIAGGMVGFRVAAGVLKGKVVKLGGRTARSVKPWGEAAWRRRARAREAPCSFWGRQDGL